MVSTSNKSILLRIRLAIGSIGAKFPGIYRPLREVFYFVRLIPHKFVGFNKNGLNKSEHRDKKIIVSLTSHPGRIDVVPWTIASLLRQTMKPDKIILWLGEEQFPDKKLPKIFKRVQACGVEIKYCHDIGSHKKYFYVMQEYPGDIIITVDDDCYYTRTLVKELYDSYVKHPNCVSSMWVSKINNELDCVDGLIIIGHESHSYAPAGGAGVLYPPHCLCEKTFNLEAVENLCLRDDDYWLKFMEVISGVKIVPVSNSEYMPGITITQRKALTYSKNIDKEYKRQRKQLIEAFAEYRIGSKTIFEIINEDK